MIEVINISRNNIIQNDIHRAIEHLEKGWLIIYPTDTSYGIGALISNKTAIDNIYRLKKRAKEKKISVVVPNIDWAKKYLCIDEMQEKILRRYLPGKYTFILKVKNSNDTLGIRLPNNNFILTLARMLDKPITATSANVSGQNDCYSIDELNRGILKTITGSNFDILVFDAGPLKSGERSTVVDLTSSKPKILRYGSAKFPK